MCYNCGCGNPADNMGSNDNITEDTFVHLGEALHLSTDEAKKHLFAILEKQKESKFKDKTGEDAQITAIFVKAAKAWGQSDEEAKRQTHDMLKSRMK